MMRTINKYTTALAAAALLAAACSHDKTETEIPLPPSSDKPICLNIKSENEKTRDTRYLIGNDYPKDADGNPIVPADDKGNPYETTDYHYYLPLSTACTPVAEGGYGFAVGLFCDYTYTYTDTDGSTKTATKYDEFRGTRLEHSESKADDKNKGWYYQVGGTKYWHPGAKYIFRAYYPQRIYNYTVSTSNATTLGIVYPTRKLQYDLLLGCAQVEATSEQMGKAVELNMDHALAALRFEFQLGFADVDWLTSVYLVNDEGRSYFSQGTVAYGNESDPENKKWFPDYNPPATEELYKWVPPGQHWGKDLTGTDKEIIAQMENEIDGKTTDDLKDLKNPVLMKSSFADDGNTIQYDIKARAYYGKEKEKDDGTPSEGTGSTERTGSTEGTAPEKGPDEAEEGQIYCRNSGWLLIIPQQSYGKLSVCFTTRKGGKTVYKVPLPAGTEFDKNKKPISTEWKAGKRYTYTITLSESNLGVDVEIMDWNERKHSTEIIF